MNQKAFYAIVLLMDDSRISKSYGTRRNLAFVDDIEKAILVKCALEKIFPCEKNVECGNEEIHVRYRIDIEPIFPAEMQRWIKSED